MDRFLGLLPKGETRFFHVPEVVCGFDAFVRAFIADGARYALHDVFADEGATSIKVGPWAAGAAPAPGAAPFAPGTLSRTVDMSRVIQGEARRVVQTVRRSSPTDASLLLSISTSTPDWSKASPVTSFESALLVALDQLPAAGGGGGGGGGDAVARSLEAYAKSLKAPKAPPPTQGVLLVCCYDVDIDRSTWLGSLIPIAMARGMSCESMLKDRESWLKRVRIVAQSLPAPAPPQLAPPPAAAAADVSSPAASASVAAADTPLPSPPAVPPSPTPLPSTDSAVVASVPVFSVVGGSTSPPAAAAAGAASPEASPQLPSPSQPPEPVVLAYVPVEPSAFFTTLDSFLKTLLTSARSPMPAAGLGSAATSGGERTSASAGASVKDAGASTAGSRLALSRAAGFPLLPPPPRVKRSAAASPVAPSTPEKVAASSTAKKRAFESPIAPTTMPGSPIVDSRALAGSGLVTPASKGSKSRLMAVGPATRSAGGTLDTPGAQPLGTPLPTPGTQSAEMLRNSLSVPHIVNNVCVIA